MLYVQKKPQLKLNNFNNSALAHVHNDGRLFQASAYDHIETTDVHTMRQSHMKHSW